MDKITIWNEFGTNLERIWNEFGTNFRHIGGLMTEEYTKLFDELHQLQKKFQADCMKINEVLTHIRKVLYEKE